MAFGRSGSIQATPWQIGQETKGRVADGVESTGMKAEHQRGIEVGDQSGIQRGCRTNLWHLCQKDWPPLL